MIEEKTRSDPVTAPVKGWRNWFNSDVPIEDITDKAGDFPAGMVWPTEDLARTKAIEVIEVLKFFAPEISYVGAFPEGERP